MAGAVVDDDRATFFLPANEDAIKGVKIKSGIDNYSIWSAGHQLCVKMEKLPIGFWYGKPAVHQRKRRKAYNGYVVHSFIGG